MTDLVGKYRKLDGRVYELSIQRVRTGKAIENVLMADCLSGYIDKIAPYPVKEEHIRQYLRFRTWERIE